MPVGTLGHALLGLLAEQPRTGYRLLKHFEQSLAYAWPASHSQIYPELARLLAAGLIKEGEALPRGGRPYELTGAGLDEVRRWLRETEPSRTVRSEATLRLFFLWLLEAEDAEAYLRTEAERARTVLAELEAIAEQEDPGHAEDARLPGRARARPAVDASTARLGRVGATAAHSSAHLSR